MRRIIHKTITFWILGQSGCRNNSDTKFMISPPSLANIPSLVTVPRSSRSPIDRDGRATDDALADEPIIMSFRRPDDVFRESLPGEDGPWADGDCGGRRTARRRAEPAKNPGRVFGAGQLRWAYGRKPCRRSGSLRPSIGSGQRAGRRRRRRSCGFSNAAVGRWGNPRLFSAAGSAPAVRFA